MYPPITFYALRYCTTRWTIVLYFDIDRLGNNEFPRWNSLRGEGDGGIDVRIEFSMEILDRSGDGLEIKSEIYRYIIIVEIINSNPVLEVFGDYDA